MIRKTLSLLLSFSLIITQPVFAQGVAELNIGKYLNQMPAMNPDSFRPPQLRYISYDIKSNDFKLLLDQGDAKLSNSPNSPTPKLQESTQELFNYFLIGLSLPNDKFWVNLRPDAPEQIIDPLLEKTDMGKIMLEADLQLKKDTSSLTSPQNPEGKKYWDKLYKKAGELFGSENITIPTITRPWIVPGEVIIRESEDSAYIYKANLKVMLEEDYLTGRGGSRIAPTYQQYTFSDPRLKELNKYSTELIKEFILPKLTQEINTSKKYAQLRQVFFSLILSRWFKDKYKGQPGQYSSLIDSRKLDKLGSKESWNKEYYFSEYKKSFQQGEYNLKEQITTTTGQAIRSYMSGGTDMTGSSKPLIEGGFKAGSPLSEDKLDNIFDTFVKAFIVLGFVYLVYPKSLYPTFIRPTKLEVVLSKQDYFDARYAIANLLDDKQLPSEDREKLKVFFSDYKVSDRKTLFRSTQAALDYFSAQEYEHEIASRLEKIRDGLKSAGSSPLTIEEVKKTIEDQFTLLSRSYNNHSEWSKIFKGYFYYADFRIEKGRDLDVLNSAVSNLVTDVAEITDPELKSALKPLVDGFKNLSKVAANKLGLLKEDEVSSALTQDLPQNSNSPLTTGGIDFTRINYLTRPMGSFQGLDLRLPLLSRAELEGIDIKQELAAMEQMINAKIEVSTDRLKRLLAAMSQKDAFTSQRETQLLPLLLRLCWLKEEKGAETTPDFRAVLLIADTGLFVEQGNTKYSLN